jgi:hypothetical protein
VAAALVGGGLLLAACAGDTAETDSLIEATIDDYLDLPARRAQLIAQESRPVETSALPPRHLDVETFPEALVERELIVAGGPPPDGIPSIDDPLFEDVADVDWLEPQEAVLALIHDGEARAYPTQVMVWHEIVNDEIAGVPISVTYCPLCSSGVAFDRRVGDRVLDFGTSGSLYQANLVMYDRQTESLWTQLDGRSVIGELVGEELRQLPLATVAWEDFANLHPEGQVLSLDTGFDRPYGRNLYASYEHRDRPVAGYFTGDADPTLPAYERVVAFEHDGVALAVPTRELADRRVVAADIGDVPVTIWHVDGMTSPLSSTEIAGGAVIGSTGVFVAEVGGEETSFSASGPGEFIDAATGSTWNILGEAESGPAAGDRLEPIPHLDTFWFAWATFQPDTILLEP